MHAMSASRAPVRFRGDLRVPSRIYGQSVLGAGLRVWNPQSPGRILMLAGIHGEEANTVGVLSRALRATLPQELTASIVLCANPDGTALGTRGNARGVDINRNYPSSDWVEATVLHRWHGDSEPSVGLSTGQSAGSEPETRALVGLVHALQPSAIVDIHSPLGEVIDLGNSNLGRHLAERLGLPLYAPLALRATGTAAAYFRDVGITYVNVELPSDGLFAMNYLVAALTPILAAVCDDIC
jgi:protein MpaA